MFAVNMTTYKDLIDHAIDFLNMDVSGSAERDARRSIQNAYREFQNEHPWSLYYQTGRINTSRPQDTGTIQYTHTGGLYERMAVLTGATWPEWADFGTLVLGTALYEVDKKLSSTVVQLTRASNPGQDVPAGTPYKLHRGTYALPADFQSMDGLVNVDQVLSLNYEHPREWLARQRYLTQPAYPVIYTITGDPDYLGTLAVRLYPPPDQAYRLDYIYKRRPRQLQLDKYTVGAVSVAAGASNVTGTGVQWAPRHVGSVLRLSYNATDLPTGQTGANPFAYARIVTEVTSPTALLLDTTVPEDFSNVKHVLSDPVDIEDGAMLTALLRGIEWQMARARNMKDRAEFEQSYRRAVMKAREADNRVFERRAAGVQTPSRLRLANMPLGNDIE